MASNWLWDFLTDKNKALDEAYKNSTLKGNNLDRQLKLVNRLDTKHDQDRGIVRSKKGGENKLLNTILGLPSQQEIKRAAQIRNNRLAQSNETKVHPWQGTMPNVDFNQLEKDIKGKSLNDLTLKADIPGAKRGLFANLADTFKGQEEGSAQINAMFGHKPSDNDNKTALLENTKPKDNNLSTNYAGGSIPNTKETSTKDPIELPEVEKGGSRWVGGNSTWVSGRTGDVIAPNIKDLPKEQVASVYKDDGSGLRTVQEQSQATKQLPKIENKPTGLSDISTSGRGAGRRSFLTPEAAKIQDAAIAKTAEPLKNAIASLPKAEQLTKAFDGTKLGTIKGLNSVAAVTSLVQGLMKKGQTANMAGKEGGGGKIGQVAVAPGINPEEFYSGLRLT